MGYGPTDGPTDGRTDKASYRDAWTHLKSEVISDGPTDIVTYTVACTRLKTRSTKKKANQNECIDGLFTRIEVPFSYGRVKVGNIYCNVKVSTIFCFWPEIEFR